VKDKDKNIDELFESWVNEVASRRAPLSAPDDKAIIKAINNRFYVGIYYQEEDDESEEIVKKGFRLIEPYVYGKGYRTKSNVIHPDRGYIRAFVIKDTSIDKEIDWTYSRRKSVSKSKRVPYWRLFRVDRMKQFTIFPKKVLAYRNLYNEKDKQMGKIIAYVPKGEFSKGENPKK